MNLTTRIRTSRRQLCAPLRQCMLAIAASLVFCGASSAIDSNPEAPGSADLILESGLPNPSRGPGPVFGAVYSNQVVGATRFYDAGYTGTRALMANIEAGYIWNGHETLSHVGLIPTTGFVLGEFDRHATVVGMIMGGRLGGANPGPYQLGIAPDAQLYSGSIATNWIGTRFTTSFDFDWTIAQTYDPYRAAFSTGISTPGGVRTADVINSSWAGSTGLFGTAGVDQISSVLDGLANTNPHTLFVAAAGNSGAGPNQVPTPGAGYNVLTVASVAYDNGAYDVPSSFSSGGPNNYQDPIRTVAAARQVVDIAAPGENISGAYYGGETGGNRPQLGGTPSGDPGGPNWYTNSTSGTSYSAPTVAGGVALLYDASYANFPANADARDARVMKAVVMNSAAKTLGWNNGQTPNPNGSGGVVTTQGLDNRVGTGRMDLNRAYDQLLAGTTDVPGTLAGFQGLVNPLGWDYGQVAQNVPNDYLINSPLLVGTTFTATLDWYRERTSTSGASWTDTSYDNLDLELWSDVAGVPTTLVSTSKSQYNDSEHFSFAIPATGQYTLRVLWNGEWFDIGNDLNIEQYGLAWSGTTASVPEPATIVLLISLIPLATGRRFARR
jgi:Subtilase family